MDNAITNDMIFVERFIWPPLRLPAVCNATGEARAYIHCDPRPVT
jgi:hypothetical protein